MIGFNVEYFKVLFNENWNFVVKLLDANEKIIVEYFQKLDVEIYYGEGKSSNPVVYLRNLYNDIISDKQDEADEYVEESNPRWLNKFIYISISKFVDS